MNFRKCLIGCTGTKTAGVRKFTLIALVFTACSQQASMRDGDGFRACTMIGCLTSIQVKFATHRNQSYRVQMEKPGLTVNADCTYSPVLGRFEAIHSTTSRAVRCDAASITLYASDFETETTVIVETFNAPSTSVERKQYPLTWSKPYYPNGESCGGSCRTAEISSTAP